MVESQVFYSDSGNDANGYYEYECLDVVVSYEKWCQQITFNDKSDKVVDAISA